MRLACCELGEKQWAQPRGKVMNTRKEHEAVVGGDQAAGIAIAAGSEPTPRGATCFRLRC